MKYYQHGRATLTLPGEIEITFQVTSDMTKAVCGMSIEQASMLRATFEDMFGVDPATLSPAQIAAMVPPEPAPVVTRDPLLRRLLDESGGR